MFSTNKTAIKDSLDVMAYLQMKLSLLEERNKAIMNDHTLVYSILNITNWVWSFRNTIYMGLYGNSKILYTGVQSFIIALFITFEHVHYLVSLTYGL